MYELQIYQDGNRLERILCTELNKAFSAAIEILTQKLEKFSILRTAKVSEDGFELELDNIVSEKTTLVKVSKVCSPFY